MQLRHGIIGLSLLVFVGCVTIPSTGSRVWYDQRMVEIETAYQNGDTGVLPTVPPVKNSITTRADSSGCSIRFVWALFSTT